METVAKLITAIAAVLGAIAWPLAVLIVIFAFRMQIRDLLERLKKGKLGFVEIELEHLAATSMTKEVKKSGAITAEQVELAARIEVQSAEIGEVELARQLDRLGIEYDTIRRTMASGSVRVTAMTRVLVKMRAIGPSVASRIEPYKGSGSPGARLAAVAIMQMQPECADVPWLVERFRKEAPFIFYHAALALQNVANEADEPVRVIVSKAAAQALGIIRSFAGVPDQDTIDVLEPLVLGE